MNLTFGFRSQQMPHASSLSSHNTGRSALESKLMRRTESMVGGRAEGATEARCSSNVRAA